MPRITSRKRKAVRPHQVKASIGNHNVFADLGFDQPDEDLAKAKLVFFIKERIRELGLTQREAGERMKIPQPRVSRLLRGDTDGISKDRLLTSLLKLGTDVEIRIKPARSQTGRFYVYVT